MQTAVMSYNINCHSNVTHALSNITNVLYRMIILFTLHITTMLFTLGRMGSGTIHM